MRTVVLGDPPAPLAAWLRSRRELGQDLFDEVWNGEHHVLTPAHPRHGDVDDQVAVLLRERARACGLWPSGPANIGEPANYRVPDRVYFAERPGRTFEPTATIVVEIVSPGDESYAKFGFYFEHDVHELLIVDPERRTVEWYARGEAEFVRAAASAVLDLSATQLVADIDWPS